MSFKSHSLHVRVGGLSQRDTHAQVSWGSTGGNVQAQLRFSFYFILENEWIIINHYLFITYILCVYYLLTEDPHCTVRRNPTTNPTMYLCVSLETACCLKIYMCFPGNCLG